MQMPPKRSVNLLYIPWHHNLRDCLSEFCLDHYSEANNWISGEEPNNLVRERMTFSMQLSRMTSKSQALCTGISFQSSKKRGGNTAVWQVVAKWRDLDSNYEAGKINPKKPHLLCLATSACQKKTIFMYLLTSNYILKKNRTFYWMEEKHWSMQELPRCG
jgi:hypothetical protein